ncbi:MAG: hypothetical protein WCH57_03170 [Verrucomicrobiota bacterium]
MKELFAQHALAQIPKILTLQDRNAHSATYGCFDRNYWHYKIIDFPSGMAQEFVWPLALAYATETPGNPYYNQPALRQWVEAGILYAARSAHPDGSCDDYFPFEKAAGAAAFTLLACLESSRLLGLDSPELRAFFTRRADWLARHHESGRLSNHAALTLLCLELAGRQLQTTQWDALKERRLASLLSWQNPEGWFQEYEGADPGYHTLTIGLLAQLYDLTGRPELRAALEKAIPFAAAFMHPDGSFGGEYTSRNTYNYFPHGFELAGKWFPQALEINDRFLAGLRAGLAPCYADDHIIGHHTWSYLLAYRDYLPQRPRHLPRPQGRVHFPNAGLLIDRREGAELYLALNKGGVFKFFRDGKLVTSDTQVSLQVAGGKPRTAVAHLVGHYALKLDPNAVTVSGPFGWAKAKAMTPFNLLVLRLIMFCGGRLNPDLVRKLLQKLLITGKSNAPFAFRRTLRWEGGRLKVSDEVTSAARWSAVRAAGLGASQTSIYVVMSRTYQPGQLQPWLDLTPQLKSLAPGAALRLEREL